MSPTTWVWLRAKYCRCVVLWKDLMLPDTPVASKLSSFSFWVASKALMSPNTKVLSRKRCDKSVNAWNTRMLPPTAVSLNAIPFNAHLWTSGSDKDSTSPFTRVPWSNKYSNLDMERKTAMSPWSDVSDKSTCWSSVKSFHSGTKVPLTSCRKRQMRQTTHCTCLAVRGLWKQGKVLSWISFHVISFFWQVESQSAFMHKSEALSPRKSILLITQSSHRRPRQWQ